MFTYPTAGIDYSEMTPEQVHSLLNKPNLIARRMAELVTNRFIADFLLRGRYRADGTGAVLYYDSAEPVLLANDEPAVVAPGGEYPLTTVGMEGKLVSAETLKRGFDGEVYDETIAHTALDPVNRTMTGMGNSLVQTIDGISLAAIQSKVTRTHAMANPFDSGEHIIEGILDTKAKLAQDGVVGYNFSTVLLNAAQYAKVQFLMIKSGLLPREQLNPLVTGDPIDLLGLKVVTSEHLPFTEPILIDPERLGGMADEDIKSPGYVRASSTGGGVQGPAMNIETKVQRLVGSDDRDGYRLRVRRVCVPVVTDPNAAIRLTGTGV